MLEMESWQQAHQQQFLAAPQSGGYKLGACQGNTETKAMPHPIISVGSLAHRAPCEYQEPQQTWPPADTRATLHVCNLESICTAVKTPQQNEQVPWPDTWPTPVSTAEHESTTAKHLNPIHYNIKTKKGKKWKGEKKAGIPWNQTNFISKVR